MTGGWLVHGSGWHPELFRAEVEALTSSTASPQTPRILSVVEVRGLAGAATVDGILGISGSSSIEGLVTGFHDWLQSSGLDPTLSVAIRWERHGERVRGNRGIDLAGKMGGILSDAGFPIDLESPQQVVKLLISGGDLFWGIPVLDSPPRLEWKQRVATARPFFKPVSLDPRQARLMVNLCGARGPFLDPMCGTGGLLIEAAAAGLVATGVDLDPEMVGGSMENLQWCGVEAEVIRGDATRLVDLGINDIHSVCFDPPYGRNAWRSDKSDTLFERVLTSLLDVVAQSARMCCMLPSSSDGDLVMGAPVAQVESRFNDSGWYIEDSWFIPVHASLGRYLIRASPLHA